jgi:hypothetical protein
MAKATSADVSLDVAKLKARVKHAETPDMLVDLIAM